VGVNPEKQRNGFGSKILKYVVDFEKPGPSGLPGNIHGKKSALVPKARIGYLYRV